MERLRQTPPFRGADGAVVPGSVAEVGFVRLGGLNQWVLVRGESLDNPPLILLHGGPGFPETQFFRTFNAPLEKLFTVVYWDQRGSGRSFDPAIPKSSMTAERFIADLDELVDWVRRTLGQSKVALFGHSWGSALGVLYAARFPEKVASYVGCGQIGDWPAGEASSYAFAVAEARRLGHQKAQMDLLAIGPPPHTPENLWIQRRWLSRLEGKMSAGTLWSLGRMFLGTPELSIFDLPRVLRGFRFSIDAMWPAVSAINLVEAAPALKMPVFFFLGRRDHWVPPEASTAYFDALSAPSKRLVWFEKSGHEPFMDEPGKFNAAMAESVRPTLISPN